MIIILLISIAVPIFLLSSCASPDNVKLSDSVGAVKYVEENFGNAELIGTNTNSVSIVYTFRDDGLDIDGADADAIMMVAEATLAGMDLD